MRGRVCRWPVSGNSARSYKPRFDYFAVSRVHAAGQRIAHRMVSEGAEQLRPTPAAMQVGTHSNHTKKYKRGGGGLPSPAILIRHCQCEKRTPTVARFQSDPTLPPNLLAMRVGAQSHSPSPPQRYLRCLVSQRAAYPPTATHNRISNEKELRQAFLVARAGLQNKSSNRILA